MSDSKASIKIEFEIYGMKFPCDMWINYSPDSFGIDPSVREFFEKSYEKAYAKFQDDIEEHDREMNEAATAKAERAEYERLKKKFGDA